MSTPLKVLIFGKHGQVGGALLRQLTHPSTLVDPERYEVIATDIEDVDLTDNEATASLVLETKPDWVLNTSAHTAVDKAESEPELAYQLNATAPETIAKACHKIGATMVHYSTDYVFDGSSKTAYLETDEPNPQSVYGRTKLAGEQVVANNLPQHFIFRTAWVYSSGGKNFVNTMLRLARDRDELKVVGDQFGSPTLADDLATATIEVMQQVVALGSSFDDPAYGIYNATGSGYTSWAGFSEEIMRQSGNDQVSVLSIPTEDYPTPAPRPAFSVLDNSKIKQRFGIQLDEWQSALRRCLRQQS
ncbi:MAG: dTDP-4-dehydrorhamnose reductase [Acidiferrobacterales bacterium]|nr:dTDP-4-dehydrorhamnose reductase [Acidiferrobacterales bacterium]